MMADTPPVDLSIIIVNYNTCGPLRRCLESIGAGRGDLVVEVIVVDNGSLDGSTDMVRAFAAEHAGLPVVLIEPGTNSWFTGGNNLGIRAACGTYALILNPDTILQPGTLPGMVAYLRDHPAAGAVSCRQEFPDGHTIPNGSRAPGLTDLLLGYTMLGALLRPWRDRRRAVMWYADWDRQSTRAVEVIPGSSLLARLDLLRQLEGFDESFKLYFTEDDICRRIRAAGREVHFLAEVMLVHEEHASVSQVQRLASQAYFDDLLVYTRKYAGRPAALLLGLLVTPTRWGMDLIQRLRGERKTL